MDTEDNTAIANAVKLKHGMPESSVGVTLHQPSFLKEAFGFLGPLFRILLHKLPGHIYMEQQTEIMLSSH